MRIALFLLLALSAFPVVAVDRSSVSPAAAFTLAEWNAAPNATCVLHEGNTLCRAGLPGNMMMSRFDGDGQLVDFTMLVSPAKVTLATAIER